MQLTLDLNDQEQILDNILKRNIGSAQWRVSFHSGNFWLSIRYHDIGGCDYDYIYRTDLEGAIYLNKTKHIQTSPNAESELKRRLK